MNEAASTNELEVVEYLLNIGVDPSKGDYDERKPLHLSSAEGHYLVVKLLLTHHRVDINCNDRWGITPCADALMAGHSDVYTLLKQNGGIYNKLLLASLLCEDASIGNINIYNIYEKIF